MFLYSRSPSFAHARTHIYGGLSFLSFLCQPLWGLWHQNLDFSTEKWLLQSCFTAVKRAQGVIFTSPPPPPPLQHTSICSSSSCTDEKFSTQSPLPGCLFRSRCSYLSSGLWRGCEALLLLLSCSSAAPGLRYGDTRCNWASHWHKHSEIIVCQPLCSSYFHNLNEFIMAC